MTFTFNRVDIALIIVVTAQAGLLAYLHNPKFKMLILTLPFPFTLATLSVGRPVDVTHVAGLLLLLAYTHGVRILHWNLRVPILPAIVIAASGYCLISVALVHVLPNTNAGFWLCAALVLGVALIFHLFIPPIVEPGHRTLLPIWIKLPAITMVVTMLVVIKQQLQGFMALFPMVGVIASYEARFCLWTVCRQIPILMFALLPMMIVIRLLQPAFVIGVSLALGRIVFLAILIPFTIWQWRSVSGTHLLND